MKKARYYLDPQLSSRILPPPSAPAPVQGDRYPIWTDVITPPGADRSVEGRLEAEDVQDGGIRLETEPEAPDRMSPDGAPLQAPCPEPDPWREEPMDTEAASEDLAARMRRIARAAALDLDDGVEL